MGGPPLAVGVHDYYAHAWDVAMPGVRNMPVGGKACMPGMRTCLAEARPGGYGHTTKGCLLSGTDIVYQVATLYPAMAGWLMAGWLAGWLAGMPLVYDGVGGLHSSLAAAMPGCGSAWLH